MIKIYNEYFTIRFVFNPGHQYDMAEELPQQYETAQAAHLTAYVLAHDPENKFYLQYFEIIHHLDEI